MSESRQIPPLILVTDGSVDTRTRIGYGAYLVASDTEKPSVWSKFPIEIKRFEDTSSTTLELQTLLWALDAIQPQERRLLIYTDSRNIIGLPARRARLVETDFRSRKGKSLRNGRLYHDFFEAIDRLDCRFFKVRGHQSQAGKNDIDRLFALVDRASRNALRQERSTQRTVSSPLRHAETSRL